MRVGFFVFQTIIFSCPVAKKARGVRNGVLCTKKKTKKFKYPKKKKRLHEYYEQQRTLKVHKEKRLANEAILEEEYRAIVAGLLLFPFLASLFLSKQ